MKLCSKPGCENIVRLQNQRYCRKCHNEYMRRWRPKYSELSDKQKILSIMRSKTNIMVTRGQLVFKRLCVICFATEKIEKHHTHPPNPTKFIPLCVTCHKLVEKGILKV